MCVPLQQAVCRFGNNVLPAGQAHAAAPLRMPCGVQPVARDWAAHPPFARVMLVHAVGVVWALPEGALAAGFCVYACTSAVMGMGHLGPGAFVGARLLLGAHCLHSGYGWY